MYKITLLLLIFSTIALSGGSNLPQVPASSVITGKDHKVLRTYFGPYDYTPGSLEDSIGNILLRHLPKPYKEGCKSMISTWGQDAKNSSATAVRPIHLVKHSENLQDILLVYTCFSTAEGYGDLYYDERLAVLRIDSARSSVTIIPHGPECDNCTELSRIGLYEDTLKIDNTVAISVIFGTSNDNPCCGGTDSIKRVEVKYFTVSSDGFKERLKLNLSRQETFHDEQNGDSTAAQEGVIETIPDEDGNIVKIYVHTENKINGITTSRGLIKYSWNPKRRAFEEEMN